MNNKTASAPSKTISPTEMTLIKCSLNGHVSKRWWGPLIFASDCSAVSVSMSDCIKYAILRWLISQSGYEGERRSASYVMKRATVNTEPPPSRKIPKVGMTSPTLDKMTIYAAPGAPEVWRFDGQEDIVLAPWLPYLRITRRAQKRRMNVRHGFRISPTGLVPHTRPIGIRPEGVPGLFARGHVVESDQVGQMRQSRAGDRLAEEDRREPTVAENLDLFLVEHFNLVAQAEAAARFVSAKLEGARRTLLVRRRDFDLLMRIERLEQRRLVAYVWHLIRRLERLPAFRELLVAARRLRRRLQLGQRFVIDHDDERRAAQARNHVEATDRPDALPLHHRHKMILEELLDAGGLDVVAQFINPQIVKVIALGPRDRNIRRARDARGQARFQNVSTIHLCSPIQSGFQINVRVNRTRMTRIERIDANLFWLHPR